MPMWGWRHGSGAAWPMALWMGFFLFTSLAILGVCIWLIARQWADFPQHKDSAATRTLRERYVRGEVDSATYEEIRAQLESSG